MLSVFLCLRRALSGLVSSVGGPQFGQNNPRITSQIAAPMTVNTTVLSDRRLGEYFETNSAVLMPIPTPPQTDTKKWITDGCSGFIFAILQARASKRNGPLVLAYAGGNA
jgi:hypothetical protein